MKKLAQLRPHVSKPMGDWDPFSHAKPFRDLNIIRYLSHGTRLKDAEYYN